MIITANGKIKSIDGPRTDVQDKTTYTTIR